MAKNILLIERSTDAAKKIDDFLSEMGYKITVCGNDDLALEFARDTSPKLIVINEKQTMRSGHDLVSDFKKDKAFAKIPIVMMATKKPRDADYTADSYIKLPPEPTKLYNAVTHWLENDNQVRPQGEDENDWGEGKDSKDKSGAAKSGRRAVINPISLGKIFHYLLNKSASGRLRLRSDRKRMMISIQNGEIIDVKTNYIRLGSLGRYLIREGKITAVENDATRERAGNQGIKQGEILVQLGILTRAELEVAIRSQKSQKLLSLFTEHWEDGEYDFQEMPVENSDDIPLRLPIAEFLATAVFNHVSPKKAYHSFLRNNKVSVKIYPSGDFDDVAERLALRNNHLKLMEVIEGNSLRDLKLDQNQRFNDIVLLTFLLAISQGIAFGEKPVRQPKKKIEEKPKKEKSKKEKPKSRPQPETPKPETPKPETPKPEPKVEKPEPAPFEQTEKLDHPPAPWELDSTVGESLSDEFYDTYEKGRVLFDDGDFYAAVPILEKALALNPQSSDALAMLAWVKYSTGGPGARDEAREMLKKSLLLDDLNDIAHLMIGQIYKDENSITQAAHHYKTAFRLNPANEDAKSEYDKLEIKLRTQRDRGF